MASSDKSDKKCTVVDEDDDLDNLLDDVLDNFSNVTVSSSAKTNILNGGSASNAPTNNAPTNNASLSSPELEDSSNGLGLEDEEYAQQFTAEMEALVKKLGDPEELRQTFEAFLKNDYTESTETTGGVNSSGNTKKSFQETINQTLNKLQKSSDQVDAEVSEEDANEEFLAEMMRQMEGLPYNGDIQDMFEKVMEQLTSKDILYEPMKHIATKYPEWLKDNKDKISQEEYERYKRQSDYIQKIAAYFEAPDYDEKNEQQNKELVDLMQKLQDFGQPPAGVLADLAPDMELDEQGLPKFLSADSDKCSIM
ncbi:10375_t:CDS:2 [Ambispora leptoticha]|uniref:10375_t:CDS:1 n=1 Tax=Ambispora leptoticha TaxID=144679 RepID=A0A9N8VDK9_9GLOM|nr:10375_t:CDS:2 [Ambispora leptoticha]